MTAHPLRLGIIGSSGGAAIAAAIECLRKADREIELYVVCDRSCGMLNWALENNFAHCLIEYVDAEHFSKQCLEWFLSNNVCQVLLFYTRIVARPLIDSIDVYNVHPSLLPSFKGINAVSMALDAGVRVLGATLHHVDEGLDTGPIIAQIATGLPSVNERDRANKISYLQKVYLTLVWYELIAKGRLPGEHSANSLDLSAAPTISSKELRAEFELLQNSENQRVI